MSSFEDDEIDNYKAKYGYIDLNDIHFDDHPYLGNEYLEYKISKIKIWTAKKGQYTVLGGIQTTYLLINKDEKNGKNEKNENNENNENNDERKDYISPEYKGEKVLDSDFVEFNLQSNEYITKATLWMEESNICKIIFKTNLKNTFSVGDAKGEEMQVDEFEKNNFLLSFFGTYGPNYLTSIGLFINKKDEFFEYFIRGYFELRLFVNKENKKKIIEEKIKNNELEKRDITLYKACLLPKNVFHEIIKFCDPL